MKIEAKEGFTFKKESTMYVPDESVDLYKAASGWKVFASRIYPLSTKL